MIENIFKLEQSEKDSAAWQKLRAHLNARLESFRKQNDHALTIEETSKLRGKIAFAKELLGLDTSAIVTIDREAGGVE